MNRIQAIGAGCALTLFAITAAATEQKIDIPALQAEGKTVIKALASQLGGELKQATKLSGLEGAIQVCNTRAAPVTAQIAEQKGWTIGRTSLKLRNQANTPDSWEQGVLELFEKQASTGANLKKMAFSQVVVNDQGQQVFRMMKAIPVGDNCLACHGSNLKPGVASRLEMLYPDDQARGFKAGDLRGAFTLQKVLGETL